MTDVDRVRLRDWCRFLRVDDSDEDGVCTFTLKFKIRDEDMGKVMDSMSYDDAVAVASQLLSSVCDGCEEYWEDWLDADNENYVMDVWMEDGFIVMAGRYRT